MLNKLFVVAAAVALSFSIAASAEFNFQNELSLIESRVDHLNSMNDKRDAEDLGKEAILSNINCLETYLNQALTRSEMKLEQYKSRLYSDQSDDSSVYYRNSRLDKKIKNTESKIKILKETMFGIQVLKLRIAI